MKTHFGFFKNSVVNHIKESKSNSAIEVHICPVCKERARIWRTTDFESDTYFDENGIEQYHTKWVAMCITPGCIEQGQVYRVLNCSLNIEANIKIEE